MKNQGSSGDRGRRDTPVLNRDPDLTLNLAEDVGEFEKGYVVGERFKVLSLLGKGGMGFVYLVKDRQTGKNYAMKTLSAMNTSARVVQRFELEAKATSLLNHPNLVQFHDFGLVDGERPYFIMDRCEGDTLADLIKSDGALSVDRVLDIFIPICSAIAYAHAQSVVHRDLKPSNIMVKRCESGVEVKVLDFGIAKILIDETAFNSLTRTGELFGSPYYMSPEQCVGKAIDCRSDIYSLGCVLFETLTGSPPFLSDHALSTMMKHQVEPPLTLKEATLGKEFPPDLEKIVAGMLAKNPEDRYQNLLLVEHDLKLLKRGERLEEPASGAQSERRLSTKIVGISAGAFLTAATATYFLVLPAFEKRPVQTSNKTTPTSGNFGMDLPDLADVSNSTKMAHTAVKGFYSDAATAHAKVRHFHFPAQQIGLIGVGDNQSKYIPAEGEMDFPVPFSLVVSGDTGALKGFRRDEVANLEFHGANIDDSSTDQFRNWQELLDLNLDWTDVSDLSIENIKTLPKLNGLHITQTHISASGLRQLNLAQLHVLEANRVAYVPQILPKKKSQLVILLLKDARLKDADMKDLAQLHKLDVLDISGNEITNQGIEYLSQLPSLQELWFSGTKVTPACMSSLKKFHNLKGVTLTMSKWSVAEKSKFIQDAKKLKCKVPEKELRF